MEPDGLILVIPDKPDPERDALAAAWARRGGDVLRLARFWDPPPLAPDRVRVYGSDSFCLVLQQKVGFELCTPADDLVLDIPAALLSRRIARRSLGDAGGLAWPAFVKSMAPKLFASRVYPDRAALARETAGLDDATEILVAEVVTFAAEARAFVAAGEVLDCAVYEGEADVRAATAFAREVARSVALPRAVVVDVGYVAGRGWAVVELNAAWGAGLNGCDPERVWPCVAAASGLGGAAR